MELACSISLRSHKCGRFYTFGCIKIIAVCFLYPMKICEAATQYVNDLNEYLEYSQFDAIIELVFKLKFNLVL